VQTVVLAQAVKRTRTEDQRTEPQAAPAKGLAPAFDSNEATQRLAALTGAATLGSTTIGASPETATQAVKSLPKGQARWRRRDWLVVGAAALCGVGVAQAILRKNDP
jgi:hypothetical protein